MNAAPKITADTSGILKRLGIDSINAGAWNGTLGWSKDVAGSLITSSNPATGAAHSRLPPRGARCPRRDVVKPSGC